MCVLYLNAYVLYQNTNDVSDASLVSFLLRVWVTDYLAYEPRVLPIGVAIFSGGCGCLGVLHGPRPLYQGFCLAILSQVAS